LDLGGEPVRARILDAALSLFEERGFDATAVPEIARRAGVATGSIYRHFESKDALVNALYREWKGRYNEQVLTPPPDGADARAVFSHYWRGMARFAQDHPTAARFLDLHHHRGYLSHDTLASDRDAETVAAAFLEAAVRAGQVRPMAPVMLIALLAGAMRGLLQFSALGRLALDEATVRAAEDCIWNGIRA
jgi:AcrR family transcriptional regulator